VSVSEPVGEPPAEEEKSAEGKDIGGDDPAELGRVQLKGRAK
jgi:hypothetical protein